MSPHQRELLVWRVLSGRVRLRVGGRTVYLAAPSPTSQYRACEVYSRTLDEALSEGAYSEDELLSFLIENELWTEEDERLLGKIPKDIEELKVALYQMGFRSREKEGLRKTLEQARGRLGALYAKRHSHDHQSAHGAALLAKSRYLLACSLRNSSGAPIFSGNSFWKYTGALLDETARAWDGQKLTEAQYRELARTEPWRSLWACRSVCPSLFKTTPGALTDEQKGLTSWSLLYERVAEHPECPPESVLADDDALDGWLILQRKKRGESDNQGWADSLMSDKVKNSEEVYLMADTLEDARKIDGLNDAGAKAEKKSRLDFVRKAEGPVSEVELPSRKRQIRMMMTQAQTQGKG